MNLNQVGKTEEYPQCCEEPMAKLIDNPRFKFSCPPEGRFYPTVGEKCSTDAEYQRLANKTRADIDKGLQRDAEKIKAKKEAGIDVVE